MYYTPKQVLEMSNGSGTHDDEQRETPLKGWDKGAFWYPTLDRRGALLGLFAVLLLLHFDELFGFATSSTLLGGWLPITFGYHILINVLHVGFMVLIYLNWPDPTDKDIERPGVVETDSESSTPGTGTAEGGD